MAPRVRSLVRRGLDACIGRERRGARRSEPPLCVVYGNCQAEAIRRLLEASPSFRSEFRTRPIPAVHSMKAETVEVVRQAVAEASLIVSHPVRDGYHGFPVGSEQMLESAPPDSRYVTIPALYYDGLFPFQVYVRDGSGTAPAAPLSVYHDLRILHCAGMGWDTATSRAWVRGFQPDPEGIQQVDSEARSSLIAYEALLDVRVSDHLTRPAALAGSFFTVNHPTNRAMQHIVAGIHAELGLPYTTAETGEELLGALRTPLEPNVIAALGLVAESRDQWTIQGQTVGPDELLALHLAWYEDRRGLVQSGLAQHETRMRALGLLR